jgi:hypothetical protein
LKKSGEYNELTRQKSLCQSVVNKQMQKKKKKKKKGRDEHELGVNF